MSPPKLMCWKLNSQIHMVLESGGGVFGGISRLDEVMWVCPHDSISDFIIKTVTT